MSGHGVEKDTLPKVSHRWRVIDATGREVGVWVERFNGNTAYDEAWALECAAKYHPGREVQVQTITTSEWTRVFPPTEDRA